MNTKKAVWISKPNKVKATLHTLSYESSGVHSVFFILGEEGEITLSYKSTAPAAIVLLHTPEEFITFGKKYINISFSGIVTRIPADHTESIKLEKKGSTLTFTSGGKEILEISKDAFSSSVSFGLATKGEGEVTLEVF